MKSSTVSGAASLCQQSHTHAFNRAALRITHRDARTVQGLNVTSPQRDTASQGLSWCCPVLYPPAPVIFFSDRVSNRAPILDTLVWTQPCMLYVVNEGIRVKQNFEFRQYQTWTVWMGLKADKYNKPFIIRAVPYQSGNTPSKATACWLLLGG